MMVQIQEEAEKRDAAPAARSMREGRHRLGTHPSASLGAEKKKDICSQQMSFWYARLDSNQRPSESESDALSNCATGAYVTDALSHILRYYSRVFPRCKALI